MSDTTQSTVHAERRIRALLAQIDPDTYNLGDEIVHSKAFRSAEWPRNSYALSRPDLEALLASLDQARSLRLEWPSIRAAINPDVHTGARAIAYLKARGWEKDHDRHSGEDWHDGPDSQGRMRFVFVPLDQSFGDWDKRMARLVKDLADAHGTGELGVLADIAEAGDA